jgi:pimeloyl-ACP methyl ester carboxylesterase
MLFPKTIRAAAQGRPDLVGAGPVLLLTAEAYELLEADVAEVSEQAVRSSWNVAAGASATASLACVSTWYEDFRKDLPCVDVPTLVIQGDADRILPTTASGLRTAKLGKGSGSVQAKRLRTKLVA